jgi:hypothetical protein
MRRLWLGLVAGYAMAALGIAVLRSRPPVAPALTSGLSADTLTTGGRDSVARWAYAVFVQHQTLPSADSLLASYRARGTLTAEERASIAGRMPLPPPLSPAQQLALRGALDTAFGPLATALTVSVDEAATRAGQTVAMLGAAPAVVLLGLTLVWWRGRNPAPAV